MLNRSQIMRTAWRRYRETRTAGTAANAPFSRRLFGAALAAAWAMARARPAVMANAWANYRDARSSRLRFCRRVFGRCLQQAWNAAKARVAFAAEKAGAEPVVPIAPRPISYRPLELPDLGFYAGRHAMQPNEAFIRAQAYA